MRLAGRPGSRAFAIGAHPIPADATSMTVTSVSVTNMDATNLDVTNMDANNTELIRRLIRRTG